MSADTGRVEFPGAVVWVSYGKPTNIDKVGCQGLYIRKVLITNAPLFLLYRLWEKLRGKS